MAVFDRKRNRVDMEDVVARSVVKCVVKLAYVWHVNGMFGFTWQLMQMMVKEEPGRFPTIPECAFEEEECEDGDAH